MRRALKASRRMHQALPTNIMPSVYVVLIVSLSPWIATTVCVCVCDQGNNGVIFLKRGLARVSCVIIYI